MIKRTYKEFLKIPFDDYYQMSATRIVSWMLILLAVLSGVLLVILTLKEGRMGLRRRWPVLLFVALYPAAINSITLMCYHSQIYTLMIFAGVLVYLLPILLVSEMNKAEGGNADKKIFRWLRTAVCGALGIVMVNYIWQSNGNYITMYYTNQQMYNYLNSMVTQIKEADGFRTDLQWAFIGDNIQDPLFQNPWLDTPFWYGGNKKHLINEYSRDRFIGQIIGYDVSWADGQRIGELEEKEAVKAMPVYPNDGSIQVIDNVVVVKLEAE